jgi:hypothetical protein
MPGRGGVRLSGRCIAAAVALLGATARAETGASPAETGAPPSSEGVAPVAAPSAAPPAPQPVPPPQPPLPPSPPPAPVAAAPEAPDLPHKTSLQTRWETTLYGFAELDVMRDSTQSYGPSSNNNILARSSL